MDDVLADRTVLGSRVAVQPGAAALRMQLPVAHRFVPLMDHVNAPVRDFRLKRTVLSRQGKRYLARPR